jgi:small subunit ribosomal protein S19e
MVSPRDVEAGKLIEKAAEELKSSIKAPEWSHFVKTGVSRERAPENKDWWYIRAASLMRKIYMKGPMGVSKLRELYGGRKNLGHRPSHARKGGGKVIRTILQDLEKIQMIEKAEKPKKGRIVSSKGEKFLVKIAKELK